jgi:hypothetical protein
VPIVVVTSHPDVARQVQGYMRNCYVRLVANMRGTEKHLQSAMEYGMKKGWCAAGDSVVCIYGSKEAVSGGTNLLQVVRVTVPTYTPSNSTSSGSSAFSFPPLKKEHSYLLLTNLAVVLLGFGLGRALYAKK